MLLDGIKQAFYLLITGDKEVLKISLLSLQISAEAVFISLILGIPLGVLLALKKFYGRNIIVSLINTGMGLPPVVVGLFVAILLWRSGPLGGLDILYTVTSMVIVQVIISFPVVVGLSMAAIQQLNPKLQLQILALGATKLQMLILLIKEAKLPLLAAIMAGFGAVISEVGAVMMVGGNIKGHTRVLTTAIVMETRMGNLDMAIALGIILLLLVFGVNFALTVIQQKRN